MPRSVRMMNCGRIKRTVGLLLELALVALRLGVVWIVTDGAAEVAESTLV